MRVSYSASVALTLIHNDLLGNVLQRSLLLEERDVLVIHYGFESHVGVLDFSIACCPFPIIIFHTYWLGT